MNEVSKIVEIIKGMKTRDKEKCIKKIISIVSNSNLQKSTHIDDWLHVNGFLEVEKYVLI